MTTNLFDLTGKIALVTGASRGIGEQIAKLLAQNGAHVIVSSRKIEGCQAVVEQIIAAGGRRPATAVKELTCIHDGLSRCGVSGYIKHTQSPG